MQAGKVIPGVPVEASPKGQLTKQEDCVPKGTIMTELKSYSYSWVVISVREQEHKLCLAGSVRVLNSQSIKQSKRKKPG